MGENPSERGRERVRHEARWFSWRSETFLWRKGEREGVGQVPEGVLLPEEEFSASRVGRNSTSLRNSEEASTAGKEGTRVRGEI